MSKRWKVDHLSDDPVLPGNIQVFIGDKRYISGDTFTATDDELDENGARPYVSEVRQQSAPKVANKAVAAPKAREVTTTPKASTKKK